MLMMMNNMDLTILTQYHGKTGELNLMNTLFDLFMAGSDTTAITLDWAVLFMIQNVKRLTLMLRINMVELHCIKHAI